MAPRDEPARREKIFLRQYMDFVLEMLTAQISTQIGIHKQFMAQEHVENLGRIFDRNSPL